MKVESTMKTCPLCGHENSDGADVCTGCGYEESAVDTVRKSDGVIAKFTQRHKNELIVTGCLVVLVILLLQFTGVTPAVEHFLAPWVGKSPAAQGAVAGVITTLIGFAIYGIVRAISVRISQRKPVDDR